MFMKLGCGLFKLLIQKTILKKPELFYIAFYFYEEMIKNSNVK